MRSGLKRQIMRNTRKLAALFSVTALVAACGGGDSRSTTPLPIPAGPEVKAVDMVTSVPAPTYTGEDLIFFNLLNVERAQCGFGLLAQNSKLDAAAFAHSTYGVLNNFFNHNEISTNPGYTGGDHIMRINAAGYPVTDKTSTEALNGGGGVVGLRGLLSAPYHMAALLGAYRDIGVAFVTNPVSNIPLLTTNYAFSSALGPQLLSTSDVLTYPCLGSNEVKRQLRGETPNPVPGRDLSVNPIGTPIFVKVRVGNTLTIDSATVVNTVTGAPVTMRTPVTANNDPYLKISPFVSYFSSSEGYIAPENSLEPNTTYQATVTGTNNKVGFTRTFTFKTGTY
jgi:uncharacterized protein YkwD